MPPPDLDAINAAVRSGSNAFHADGFYYYKDRNLSARDPFASFKPFERRQQFGASESEHRTSVLVERKRLAGCWACRRDRQR